MSTVIDQLITDRTQADLTALYAALQAAQNMTPEQRSQYLAGFKGAYKASDLNRVETAVGFIAALLQAAPSELETLAATLDVAWGDIYELPYDPDDYTFTTKTDWAIPDLPTVTDMARYLNNVNQIITAISAVYPSLPNSMAGLTVTQANHIEQALRILYNAFVAEKTRIEALIEKTAASFVYSGQPYSGQIWSEFTA